MPPARLLRCFPNRMPPHVCCAEEIQALLHAVVVLFRQPLRVATYRTLIGLLSVTRLRIGDAVGLDRDHVDLDAGVLTIAESKYGKSGTCWCTPARSRRCAITPTCATAPRGGIAATAAFFVPTRGRLLVNTVDYTFADLLDTAGVQVPPGVRRPGWRVGPVRGSGIAASPFPGPLTEPAVPVSRQRALRGVCCQAWFVDGHGVGILLPR